MSSRAARLLALFASGCRLPATSATAAASAPVEPGSEGVHAKIGAYWRACIDEDRRIAAGQTALEPLLLCRSPREAELL